MAFQNNNKVARRSAFDVGDEKKAHEPQDDEDEKESFVPLRGPNIPVVSNRPKARGPSREIPYLAAVEAWHRLGIHTKTWRRVYPELDLCVLPDHNCLCYRFMGTLVRHPDCMQCSPDYPSVTALLGIDTGEDDPARCRETWLASQEVVLNNKDKAQTVTCTAHETRDWFAYCNAVWERARAVRQGTISSEDLVQFEQFCTDALDRLNEQEDVALRFICMQHKKLGDVVPFRESGYWPCGFCPIETQSSM